MRVSFSAFFQIPVRQSSVFFRVVTTIATAVAALLAGCADPTPAPLTGYQPENFSASNAYAHTYAASPARTCEAARRALLSQGYVVDAGKPDQVAARKYFQPDPDHHVQLEFRVVCVAQGHGAGGGATVFASGLQDQYTLRKVRESASLGVGAFGSLSLPFQGGTDAMVKVASVTVTDAALYQRFFDLIGDLLRRGEVPEPVAPPVAAAASAPLAAASAVITAVPMPVLAPVSTSIPTQPAQPDAPLPAPAAATSSAVSATAP